MIESIANSSKFPITVSTVQLAKQQSILASKLSFFCNVIACKHVCYTLYVCLCSFILTHTDGCIRNFFEIYTARFKDIKKEEYLFYERVYLCQINSYYLIVKAIIPAFITFCFLC